MHASAVIYKAMFSVEETLLNYACIRNNAELLFCNLRGWLVQLKKSEQNNLEFLLDDNPFFSAVFLHLI